MPSITPFMKSFALSLLLVPAGLILAADLVPYGSTWRYLDDGSDQGTAWREQAFVDSSWAQGAAQFGYGDGDEATTVASSRITYYFRHEFSVTDASAITSATLEVLYDDGAIVYLNGTEIHRTSLLPASGEVAFDVDTSGFSPDNSVDAGISVAPALFVDGVNLLAVEIHNDSATSSDISFDLRLEATLGGGGSQATVTFREGVGGYSGTADATIRSAAAATNYGSAPDLLVDGDDGSPGAQPNQALLRFDSIFGSGSGQIPIGATIDNATLTYTVFNRGGADMSIYALAAGATWDEGTVTWNNVGTANDGVSVSDRTGSPVTGPDNSATHTVDVTTIVAAWAAGDTNNGFVFLPNSTNGIDFHSSEHGTVAERPLLSVTYTAAANPDVVAFTADPIDGPDATAGIAYSASLAGFADDPDNDTPLTFAKVTGPAWLTVASDGTLSGTPAAGDAGANVFTVSVTDTDDGSDTATLNITVDAGGLAPTTLSFRNGVNGYSGTVDTALREPFPTTNYGGDSSFSIDSSDGGGVTHGVIRFDGIFGTGPDQIPNSNIQIESATLTYTAFDPGGSNLSIFQVASGATWAESTADWSNFGTGSDGVGSSDRTGSPVSGPASVATHNVDVTAIVAAWAAGATNNGFALLPNSTNGCDIYTSEDGSTANRPMLEVTYSVTNPNTVYFNQDPFTAAAGTVGTAYTGSIASAVTDPDTDILTFGKSSGPAWLTVGTGGELGGVPGINDVGANEFVVSVTDADDGSDFATLAIDVLPSANAVSFTSDPITGPDARATVAYSGTLVGTTTDPDGDTPVFRKINGPDWLEIATSGALGGTPEIVDIGLSSFTVEVTDGGDGLDTATLNITVNDQNGNPPAPPALSATSQLRLIWLDDPSSTVTVAWRQNSGSPAVVHYGTEDFGRFADVYPDTALVTRSRTYTQFGSITTQFAEVSGLLPDTVYYFVLKDDTGVSERYWFQTAPAEPKPFSFVAGGDSRNNRTPRQRANRLVAKLRPLFVAFTGDMIDRDNATEWNDWLNDWQETIAADGRVTPIVPHRGNHESRGNATLVELFDAPSNNFYALSFGGNLLRYYVLNSESGESTQTSLVQNDLNAEGGAGAFTHLMAGYHKPMRPHTAGKSEGSSEYSAWAQLFYNNGFDLIFESDSHMMKRTLPVRPSTGGGSDEGFVTDVVGGTVYVGEGCWGAPLRSADDGKNWTLDLGSFNGFDLVRVFLDYVEVYTVRVDNESSVGSLENGDELSLPPGIDLWEASGGRRLIVNRGTTPKLSYSQMQLDTFGGDQPPASSMASRDHDNDGHSNRKEFAFFLNMLAPDGSATIKQSLPRLVRGPSGEPLIRHRMRANTTVRFRYWVSQDLVKWTLLEEGTDYTVSSTPGAGFEDLEIELIGAVGSLDSAFFRVEFGER